MLCHSPTGAAEDEEIPASPYVCSMGRLGVSDVTKAALGRLWLKDFTGVNGDFRHSKGVLLGLSAHFKPG